MDFNIEERDQITVIIPKGQLMGGPDATTLAETARDMLSEGKQAFLVDMVHVDRMNSSGLGILIGGLTTIRNGGGSLKLLNVKPKIRELLKITKLDRVFEIYDNEEEAIASFT